MKKAWTKEQYDERARVMKESDEPLMYSKPGQGYFGSREMVADFLADNYYSTQILIKKVEKLIKK